MPGFSSSPAGAPRSGRSQQLRPSPIMPSIRTRMGSESAWPRATSRATRSSRETPSRPEGPPNLSSTTSNRRRATRGLLLVRLAGPDEGACQWNFAQRLRNPGPVLGPAAAPGRTGELRFVGVGDLDRDVFEARPLQQRLVLGLLQRPGDAPGPQLGVAHQARRDPVLLPQEHHIGDREPAAWLEHPERLAYNPLLRGGEVDDAVAYDDVHVIVGQRDILYLPLEELRVLDAGLAPVLAGKLQHLIGHVETIRLPARRHPPRREQDVYPAAAPQIQDHLARREGRKHDRVAAAKRSLHRSPRQLALLVLRVAPSCPVDPRRLGVERPPRIGPTARRSSTTANGQRGRSVPPPDLVPHRLLTHHSRPLSPRQTYQTTL